jgi:hypothetical protein
MEKKLLSFLSNGAKVLDQVFREGVVYGNKYRIGPWDLRLSEKAMILKNLPRLVSINRWSM